MRHLSTRQRVGLGLAGLLSLGSLPSVLTPTPDGQVGPPLAVLALSTVLGAVGVVATAVAWLRGSATAMRVLAGSVVVGALVGLPAFFVDVPAWVKLTTAVSVLATIAAVVLLFSPARRDPVGTGVAS